MAVEGCVTCWLSRIVRPPRPAPRRPPRPRRPAPRRPLARAQILEAATRRGPAPRPRQIGGSHLHRRMDIIFGCKCAKATRRTRGRDAQAAAAAARRAVEAEAAAAAAARLRGGGGGGGMRRAGADVLDQRDAVAGARRREGGERRRRRAGVSASQVASVAASEPQPPTAPAPTRSSTTPTSRASDESAAASRRVSRQLYCPLRSEYISGHQDRHRASPRAARYRSARVGASRRVRWSRPLGALDVDSPASGGSCEAEAAGQRSPAGASRRP